MTAIPVHFFWDLCAKLRASWRFVRDARDILVMSKSSVGEVHATQ